MEKLLDPYGPQVTDPLSLVLVIFWEGGMVLYVIKILCKTSLATEPMETHFYRGSQNWLCAEAFP